MIIVAIIALSAVVLTLVYAALVGLPTIPSEIMSIFDLLFSIIQQAVGVFWSYVHPAPVQAMIAISLVVGTIYYGYSFVMWVTKKIPMLAVSD